MCISSYIGNLWSMQIVGVTDGRCQEWRVAPDTRATFKKKSKNQTVCGHWSHRLDGAKPRQTQRSGRKYLAEPQYDGMFGCFWLYQTWKGLCSRKNVASTPENVFFSFLHSCSGLIRGALRRLVASGEKFLNETLMWIEVDSSRVQTDSGLLTAEL